MKRFILSTSLLTLMAFVFTLMMGTNTYANEKNNDLSDAEAEIVNILQEIEKNNVDISKLEHALKLNHHVLSENEKEISHLNDEIEDLQKTIDKRNKILLDRVAAYQDTGGDVGYLEVLLGAKNFSDFLSRVQAVYAITTSDMELIEANQKDKAHLEKNVTELERRSTDLIGQQETIQVQKDLLTENKSVLETQEKQVSQHIKQLENKSEALTKIESTIRENIENNKQSIEDGNIEAVTLTEHEPLDDNASKATETATAEDDQSVETTADNAEEPLSEVESSGTNNNSTNSSHPVVEKPAQTNQTQQTSQPKTEAKPASTPEPAAKPESTPKPKPVPKPKPAPEPKPEPKPEPAPKPQVNTSGSVTSIGNQFIGHTEYVWGSASPSNGGFDCSGFVQWAYQNAAGISLPRSTYSQINAGTKVNYSSAQPGDLVFFDTAGKNSHVGIYLGGGSFIGSQNSTGVGIASINGPYWKDVFNGTVVRVR